MLVQRKVPAQTETVEIKLPYFSKDGATFFMITAKEDVLKIYNGGISSYISVTRKFELGESCAIQDAIEATPCTAAEVEEAKNKALEFMDNVLSKSMTA